MARLVLGAAGALLALVASAWAVLVALPGAGPAPAPPPSCAGTSAAALECEIARLGAVARADGVPAALRLLRRDIQARDVVRANCHQAAHAVAHAGPPVRGPGDLVAEGDPLCGAGLYAGRVEGFVTPAVAGRPAVACARVRRRDPRSNHHHNCAHAVGHGLLAVARGRIGAALRGCDRMGGPFERDACASGVFMENLTRSTPGGPQPRMLSPARPFLPCERSPWRHRRACYGQQVAYPLRLSGGDLPRVFAMCARLPVAAHRAACERGLGANVAWSAMSGQITQAGAAAAAAAGCELGADAAARRRCAVGAVRMVVDHRRRPAAGEAVCRRLSPPSRPACRAAARAHLAGLGGAASG